MKPKMGRPRLPKGLSKDSQYGVRYNPSSLEIIQAAIEKSGTNKTMAEWIRDETITSAEQWEKPHLTNDIFWGELPFSKEEMNDKRIAFKVWIKWPEHKTPLPTSGTGTMFIRQRPNGSHVRIISNVSANKSKVIDLTSFQAALIKKSPNGSDCEFSLAETQP